MHIPSSRPVLIDRERTPVDRFDVYHDKNVAFHKKEKKLEKKYMLHDRQIKAMKEIAEEKIVIKENNERWKQLNIIS